MCLFVYPYSQQHYSQHLKCGRNSVIHWGNEWISKMWYMYVCVCVYTHIYNGPLFSLKKEGNSDIHYDMDEYWGHSVKWNKPDVKGQTLPDWLIRMTLSGTVKFTETQREWWVSGAVGSSSGELLFYRKRASVWQDGKSLGAGQWWWVRSYTDVLGTNELHT